MRRRVRRDRPLVVFVDHVARLSGGEIAISRLLPALQHVVDVHVVLGEDGPLVERLQRLGIPLEVLAMDPVLRDAPRAGVRPALGALRQAAQTLRYVVRLRRRLRQLRPDLVHTNSLKSAIYGGLAGRAAGIPVVWHIRDRIAPDYLPRAGVHLVRGLARVLPTAVIVNSEATRQTLPESLLSVVVHSAVVPESVPHGAVPEPGSHADSLVLGVVGRLAEWKGQHVFLEAFAAAFLGSRHRGWLIGSAMFGEEAYERRLRALVEEFGLTGQVELVGFREDVEREYAALDVLVHCSVVPEPFGQVVIEGMAAGLAVIASAAGGPLEIVDDGVDGLLVPPGDAPALAAAMRRLDADRELLRRLGQHAAVSARRFSATRTAERVLAVYRDVLGPDDRLGSDERALSAAGRPAPVRAPASTARRAAAWGWRTAAGFRRRGRRSGRTP